MKTSRLLLLSAALFTSCAFEPALDKPGVEVVPVSFSGNGSGSASATLDWRSFFADPRLKKLVGIGRWICGVLGREPSSKVNKAFKL